MARSAVYVRDARGREVFGLYSENSKQRGTRFYAWADGPDGERRKVWFGSDKTEAIYHFRQFQGQGEFGTINVPLPHPSPQLAQPVRVRDVLESTQFLRHDLPLPTLYAWARKAILDNPSDFARNVGISEIAYLNKLIPPDEPITFETLIDDFIGEHEVRTNHRGVGVKRVKHVSGGAQFKYENDRTFARRALLEFQAAIKRTNLCDVTTKDVMAWRRNAGALGRAVLT